MISPDTEEKSVFYFNARKLWSASWLAGLAIMTGWYGLYIFLNHINRYDSYFIALEKYLVALSIWFFLIGTVSVLCKKMRYAVLTAQNLILFTGIPLFRISTLIEWKNVSSAVLDEKKEYYAPSVYGGPLDEVYVDAIIINLINPLNNFQINKIKSKKSRIESIIHHIRTNDTGTKIWLTKPPAEGFKALLDRINAPPLE